MAEQIISPGVFTRENDQTFLPQGVGAIGAAIVGPTVKGPAFVPTVVKSFAEYERRFGTLNSETFVPQTVREYLKNAGSVTVCRVLAGGGYTLNSGKDALAVIAGSGTATAAVSALANMAYAGAIVENDSFFVTSSDGTIHTFTYVDTPVPADVGNTHYVLQGTTAATLENLVFVLNNSASLGGTFVSASTGPASHVLQFTASAGKSGNGIGFQSGSVQAVAAGGLNASIAGGVLMGVIFPSKNENAGVGLGSSAIAGNMISSSFYVTLDGTGWSATNFSASLNPVNEDYLFKYIGDNPNNSKGGVVTYDQTPGYTYLNFKNLQTSVLATDSLTGYSSGLGSGSGIVLSNMNAVDMTFNGGKGQTEGYSYASTPWIQGQIALGRKQLFKFHTINHGTLTNTDYKVSIANLKEPSDIDGEEQYSTFSVIVRKYNDTDKNPIVLEQYNNLNLNPDSPNYIARKIGDRYPQYNDTLDKVELLGNYSNISDHIRVEVDAAVDGKSTSPKLSPKGFSAVYDTINSASFDTNFNIPSASFEGTQEIGGNYNSKAYLGWKFNEKDTDNANWIKPLPQSAITNAAGNFSVENHSAHASSGNTFVGSLSASLDSTGTTGPTANQLKFTVPFQGGEDGVAPYTVKFTGAESAEGTNYSNGHLYGFDLSSTSGAGYKGYKKALDILSNQDEYDINMLAMPGVIKALHPTVTNAGIDLCEGRGDAFFVMDLDKKEASVKQAISTVQGIDTNYAAAYYPWVKVLDTVLNKPVMVPPSVIVPGAIAASDAIGAEWFAPAGLNRGVLGNVIEAKIRLNQAERDVLYNEKINPIATFPQTGVCIWGQKTLQERPTALDRINVRRLLITLKKFIASSSKYLVFEQNTVQTRNRFLNIVNPYLESVQQRQGLFAFRVQMDEANNTPDVIDRNQLVGGIYLQPAKTAEFIVLDFNIMPTGATFPA
jgi:phage tail sheath protein FI